MNTKRLIFWISFVVIIILIVWGLIAAQNKSASGPKVAEPAAATSTDHIRGSVNAPVTLIEYGDFQCPACGSYFPIVERVFNESSSTMRMIFRNFPLSQHPNAIPAALAAESAAQQGKYWQMYDKLYSNQTEWSDVADASSIFATYASQIGLNMSAYKAYLTNPAAEQKILADQDEGIHIGIDHTPTFFLNGKVIAPNSYDEFKSLVDAAATSSSK